MKEELLSILKKNGIIEAVERGDYDYVLFASDGVKIERKGYPNVSQEFRIVGKGRVATIKKGTNGKAEIAWRDDQKHHNLKK